MGRFFVYVPGRLDVRFRQVPPHDLVIIHLRMHGGVHLDVDQDEQGNWVESVSFREPRQEAHLRVYSTFCPFRGYMAFLDAITTRVEECAFEWDDEGSMARLEWHQGYFADTGVLFVRWGRWDNHPRLRDGMHASLNTRQAVRMMYQAFRRWVESPEYDPSLYEQCAGNRFGSPLRKIRSPVVEAWLAQPEPPRRRPWELPDRTPGPPSHQPEEPDFEEMMKLIQPAPE